MSPKIAFATKCHFGTKVCVSRLLLYAQLSLLSFLVNAPAAIADDAKPRTLQSVASPPPLQMFVPGFTVRELPVQLTNVNNVLYREDGLLVALAYDGNIYLLRDTDGDGLEDHVSTFWKNEGRLRAPIGMALTPPGYSRGRGVFVPSKSKLSLLLDVDGDDVAEQEVIVASGWRELWTQVDALGVAVDPRDQSIYFGLGTWNFANGYQVNDQGVAEYRLDDEHGTILRVTPDFSSREILCTGVRFPVALRFHRDGELFCTDQEGATWLANGNPFDELLHIQRGRHYGFPPRHPKHLPAVIDEPSVFDYRPQHQSTCGLNFNEPASDGTIFGPEWWRSDAIVTGYSRGKLYRTKLARTTAGYVAQNQLIGATRMLLADACIAPNHSLVLAAHSGGPDWGSGPGGQGKLYKVTYEPRDAPLPSLVWAASETEVRIAFDRPVDPQWAAGLQEKVHIDAGRHIAAGDRFESLRPGYAVVEHQARSPRYGVALKAVTLADDARTLILATAPHSQPVNYAIALTGALPPSIATGSASGQTGRPQSISMSGALPQDPDIDLQYDLHGVEAVWEPSGGDLVRAWLPSVDLDVSRELTKTSAEHDRFWKAMHTAGTLTLRTALDLKDLLRPAVQPGGVLDYELPAEQISLTVSANWPVTSSFDGAPDAELKSCGDGNRIATLNAQGEHSPAHFVLVLRKPHQSQSEVFLRFATSDDPRPRALPLHRFFVPWADRAPLPPETLDNRHLPELAGGDWHSGKQEFFGSEAGCSKCHAIRGEGGAIGPNLSNLPQRDYVSVLRDIEQPSYAINPDYATQTILLAAGRALAGTVRTEGDQVVIADSEGKETMVLRTDIESIEPATQSIMPQGIPKALGPDRMKNLMTFLLNEPPQPAEASPNQPAQRGAAADRSEPR